MAHDLASDGFADALAEKPAKRGASATLWVTCACIAVFAVWASVFEIDEVAVGQGKVTPSSKGQMVQSLEGGILSELLVHEGDIVEAGQVMFGFAAFSLSSPSPSLSSTPLRKFSTMTSPDLTSRRNTSRPR